MQSFPIVKPIQQLFEQHSIPYKMEEDWLIPYGDFVQYPAIRLLWFPYTKNGCLQVEVFHYDQTLMIECFAGVGVGEVAIEDAFHNFTVNSFHVFAVAFWKLKQDNQVTIEQWQISGKSYTAYLGTIGTRQMHLDCFPVLPENWFTQFTTDIKHDTALGHLSWFRLFVGNNKDHLSVEVLKNNEPWEEAQEHVRKLPWASSEGYYSIRQFVILKAQ